MRMEPTESSETSAINVTWTPGTYPKDKLQLEYGESLKSWGSFYLLNWSTPCVVLILKTQRIRYTECSLCHFRRNVFLILRIFYIQLYYFLGGAALYVGSLKSGRNVLGLGGGGYWWGLIGCSHINLLPHTTLWWILLTSTSHSRIPIHEVLI